MNKEEKIKTKIWMEEPGTDNPFAAARCYCSGYDVYGDLLGKISWIEYLYLLFRLELPTKKQAQILEIIAVAIANPGIRDHSVRAAMNAGVGGSTHASALIAAIGVGAGSLGGGREILELHRLWQKLDKDIRNWEQYVFSPPEEEPRDAWLPIEHIPGFDPNGASCPLPVLQVMDKLVPMLDSGRLSWLRENVKKLEQIVGYPLAMSGVIGTALVDMGFDEAQSEALYLILRLPGAAAHSLEQEKSGWRHYPFFGSDVKAMGNEDYQQVLAEYKKF